MACGLGGPAVILACDYGARVDGVNIVERQVRWARQYMEANGVSDKVRIHLASAMELPFADQQFDVLFCLEAAHCFLDKRRFLQEARRVLREDGRLVLADIVGTGHLPVANWQPALKLNLITASDWAKLLEEEGFAVAEKTMVGDAVYPGCRWWAAQLAPERRRAIFAKSCRADASALRKKIADAAGIHPRISLLPVGFADLEPGETARFRALLGNQKPPGVESQHGVS